MIFCSKSNPIASSQKGALAEKYAENYLIQQGLIFIERNYSCKCGEIDLIMKDQSALVFVEVRYRKNNVFGGALASINRKKQLKMVRTAQYYLSYKEKCAKIESRFDVVSIEGSLDSIDKLYWVKNAIDSTLF